MIKITEYNVSTCVDSWDEIKVQNKNINIDFLMSIIPDLKNLEFVRDVYIADNGLLRIDIKNLTPISAWKYSDDIAVHPASGHFTMMRHDNTSEFKEYEDIVVNTIVRRLEQLK